MVFQTNYAAYVTESSEAIDRESATEFLECVIQD